MKHDQLCAIGHNLADSMASGVAFVIGYHPVDVFAEAATSSDSQIEIDFLRGAIMRGNASQNLRSAALRFAERFPAFCRENGADVSDFEALSVTFDATRPERRALLYVADRTGRCSATEYAGLPLKRLRCSMGLAAFAVRQGIPRQATSERIGRVQVAPAAT